MSNDKPDLQRNPADAYEFDVVTNFQKAARRPGGIPRDKALQAADNRLKLIKPKFSSWLDDELRELVRVVPNVEAIRPDNPEWIDGLERASKRLSDVAETMDYQFVSFVANNLCIICEAVRAGAECQGEVVICHVNALLLGAQLKYRRMKPADLPELSDGLRKVLDSKNLRAAG